MKTGGLDLQVYTTESSVDQNRDTWETVLKKLKTGEMPPEAAASGCRRVEGGHNWIRASLIGRRMRDANPGRVTARR